MVTKFILCFDGQVWSFPMYAVDCISTNAKTKVNIRSDDLMSPQKEIVLKSSIIKHTEIPTLAIHKMLWEYHVLIQNNKNFKISLIYCLIYCILIFIKISRIFSCYKRYLFSFQHGSSWHLKVFWWNGDVRQWTMFV